MIVLSPRWKLSMATTIGSSAPPSFRLAIAVTSVEDSLDLFAAELTALADVIGEDADEVDKELRAHDRARLRSSELDQRVRLIRIRREPGGEVAGVPLVALTRSGSRDRAAGERVPDSSTTRSSTTTSSPTSPGPTSARSVATSAWLRSPSTMTSPSSRPSSHAAVACVASWAQSPRSEEAGAASVAAPALVMALFLGEEVASPTGDAAPGSQ
jgi:hypothetical protein